MKKNVQFANPLEKLKNRKYNQSKSNEYKEGREKFCLPGVKNSTF